MRRITHFFRGSYRKPTSWSILPAVQPEESAAILKRQMAKSKEMLDGQTRIDVSGKALWAERGVENFPRRDGRIIEPLHHHRLHDQSRSMFLGAPTPVSKVD